MSKVITALEKYPIDDQHQLAASILRDKYNNSLFLTAKLLLGYKDVNPYTHGDMIRALEAPSKRKLIVMPRGTFKSSVGSVAYAIWSLNRDPDIRIMLDSELYSNSKNLLREIKIHLENPKLTSIFGEYKNKNIWNESEILINQRRKTYKEASITASGIGAEKTGQHYQLIILDDANSPNNSGTTEGREKVLNHYRYLTSILEPEGTLVVIGTRYCSLDVPGSILKNELELDMEGNV